MPILSRSVVYSYIDLYAEVMAEDHHALRISAKLWKAFAGIVGDIGRGTDLKRYLDWRSEHPDHWLGPDPAGPHDFLATFRVERVRWDLYSDAVPAGRISSDLRSYVQWRVHHPSQPLPGRRLPPIARRTRRPAYA